MPDQTKDTERLDEAAARRLIERATELDARMKSQSTVADLREAARGAGISDEAFQWALSEVREGQHPDTRAFQEVSRQHRRMKGAVAIIAALMLTGILSLFVIPRVAPPSRPSVDVEETAPAVPTKTTTKSTKTTTKIR